MAEKIPSWPKVTIRLYDDHNAEVKIAGRSHPVNHHDPRQAAIALVSERAGQLGRPVKATAVESDGASWPLVIHPDGRVEAIEGRPQVRRTSRSGRSSSPPGWPASDLRDDSLPDCAQQSRRRYADPTESPKLPVAARAERRPGPVRGAAGAAGLVDATRPGRSTSPTDSTPAVSPDGSEVAVLTPDHKIAVFDSHGKVLWQDKVPKNAESPVYTTIDSKPVLAVTTPKTLLYWPGDGIESTEVELPDGAPVQFFGTSPLVLLNSRSGCERCRGRDLHPVPDQQRLSTILLAEGDKTLMARYAGPLYWSQTGKDLVEVPSSRRPGPGSTISRCEPGSCAGDLEVPSRPDVVPR